MRKRMLRRGFWGDTVSYAYLTLLAILAAFPLLWILQIGRASCRERV